jgi:uncharacterized membrane protein
MSKNPVPEIRASAGLRPIHPLHAMLLAFPLPLFLGAWFSDLAYTRTFQVQWVNFASWLIVGALVGGGFALLWVLIDIVRDRAALSRRQLFHAGVMLVMWVLGFINALIHGKDAWASMPEGMWLSFIATVLAFIGSWIGYSGLRAGDAK